MSNYTPMDYPPQESSKLGQLKVAAILLLVAGGLAILGNIYFIFSVSFQVAIGKATPPPTTPPGQEVFYMIGFYSPLVLGIIALPLLAFMMFGAVAMLRQRGLGMAKTGAVLAVVPFTASCCCILTLPFGIWALILLAAPEVKAAFQTTTQGQ